MRKHKPFFVALDGEAIEGDYVLLGSSLANHTFEHQTGIQTDEIIHWLCNLGTNKTLRKKHPVFIGFFFSYDIEMIFKDLSDGYKERLFKGKAIEYNGYRIKTIKKKFLSIRTIAPSGRTTNGITIYDIAGFFPGMNFIKVCKRILGYTSDELTQGKANRTNFTWKDWKDIKSYNRLECELLVKVMDKVADMLAKEDLTPGKWYGSSAVANSALRRWKIGEEMRRTVLFDKMGRSQMPEQVYNALLCAYFGGRIEAFKLGSFNNVNAYDINSAYPSEIAKLWSNKGTWNYTRTYNDSPFAVWHIEYNLPKDCYMGLFPFREQNGSIKYPLKGKGWYWTPEVHFAMSKYPNAIKVLEGYYKPELKQTSLATRIPAMYRQRQEYKAKGELTEYILKITLNSLYGKFAQKVGASDYRNFVWAGFITSATRAKLLSASFDQRKSVIAFATDGIYTSKTLNVSISKQLGEWSHEFFETAHILMSGVYQLRSKEKEIKTGERGFKHIVWDEILEDLTHGPEENGKRNKKRKGQSDITTQSFIGFNMAFHFPKEYGSKYLKFVQQTKTLCPANLTKRNYRLADIKDWKADSCDSMPVKHCPGESAPIATQSEISDEDIYYREDELDYTDGVD